MQIFQVETLIKGCLGKKYKLGLIPICMVEEDSVKVNFEGRASFIIGFSALIIALSQVKEIWTAELPFLWIGRVAVSTLSFILLALLFIIAFFYGFSYVGFINKLKIFKIADFFYPTPFIYIVGVILFVIAYYIQRFLSTIQFIPPQDEDIIGIMLVIIMISLTSLFTFWIQKQKILTRQLVTRTLIEVEKDLHLKVVESYKKGEYTNLFFYLRKLFANMLELRYYREFGYDLGFMPHKEFLYLAYEEKAISKEDIDFIKKVIELSDNATHGVKIIMTKEQAKEWINKTELILKKLGDNPPHGLNIETV